MPKLGPLELKAELEQAIRTGNGAEIQRLRMQAEELRKRGELRPRSVQGKAKSAGAQAPKNAKQAALRKVPRDVPTGSLMGETPSPRQRGHSARYIMASGDKNLPSAGMPGNEETDPGPRHRR